MPGTAIGRMMDTRQRTTRQAGLPRGICQAWSIVSPVQIRLTVDCSIKTRVAGCRMTLSTESGSPETPRVSGTPVRGLDQDGGRHVGQRRVMGHCQGANQRGSGRPGQTVGDIGRLAGATVPPEVPGTNAHGSSRATKSGLHPVGVDPNRSLICRCRRTRVVGRFVLRNRESRVDLGYQRGGCVSLNPTVSADWVPGDCPSDRPVFPDPRFRGTCEPRRFGFAFPLAPVSTDAHRSVEASASPDRLRNSIGRSLGALGTPA